MTSTLSTQHSLFTSVQEKGFDLVKKANTKEEKEQAKTELTREFIAQAFTKLLTPSDEKEGFMGSGPVAVQFMDFLGRGIVEASNLGLKTGLGAGIASTTLVAGSGMTELLKLQGEGS